MIIDRYLLREIIGTFMAISAVLVVIFLAYSLTLFLTDAAGGLLKAHEVVTLTAIKSLIALEVLLPIALYFGLIITFGRLNNNSEMAAIHASGFSRRRVFRPVLLFAFFLASVVGCLSTAVRPWAYHAIYTLEKNAEAASELDRIKPERFYIYKSANRTVYVAAMNDDGRELRGVFIRVRKGDDIEVISAARGRLEPFVTPERHRLVLSDVSVYKSVADGPDFYGDFETFTMSLAVTPPEAVGYRHKAESTVALFASSLPEDRAEVQWRLSTPVSTLLLALAAMRLNRSRPREGKYARLPMAIGLYAIYFNLLGVNRTWVEQGSVLSLWWVPLGLALLIGAAYLPWRLALNK